MKFSWEDLLYRGYTHSTSEPMALPLRVTAVVRFTLYVLHIKTNVMSLIRCDATCFPRGVTDWQKQSAIVFTFIFIVHAIRIAFGFIFVVCAIRIAFTFILLLMLSG